MDHKNRRRSRCIFGTSLVASLLVGSAFLPGSIFLDKYLSGPIRLVPNKQVAVSYHKGEELPVVECSDFGPGSLAQSPLANLDSGEEVTNYVTARLIGDRHKTPAEWTYHVMENLLEDNPTPPEWVCEVSLVLEDDRRAYYYGELTPTAWFHVLLENGDEVFHREGSEVYRSSLFDNPRLVDRKLRRVCDLARTKFSCDTDVGEPSSLTLSTLENDLNLLGRNYLRQERLEEQERARLREQKEIY